MKSNQIIAICMYLTLALLSIPALAADVVVLNSPGAGKLKLTKEALTATHLKVTGKIDARDFKTLKTVTINRTRVLDLSEVEIASYSGRDGCYYPKTSDWVVDDNVWLHDYDANTLPIHAFAEVRDNSIKKWYEGSYSLRRLILPSNLRNIETDALRYNTHLTEVVVPQKAQFLTGDNHVIYTSDYKRLVAISPAYTGNIDIPKSVTTIESNAFIGVKLSYVKFNSEKAPQINGTTPLDAACIIVPNINNYSGKFGESDCVEEIKEIIITDIKEGEILTELGNAGYKREDVREVRISGELSQEDISNLISLPNVHKMDLSQATTSARYVTITPSSSLCNIQLPIGEYSLNIEDGNFLEGELIIPEGVWDVKCFNRRLSVVKFPSTLGTLTEDSFDDSIIREADFSLCSKLSSISGFTFCANLEKLTLPSTLSTLEGVTHADFKTINLPNSLTTLSSCSDWGIDTLNLPASLKEIKYVGEMPNLKHVDIASCTQLASVDDCFNNCPKLETIDFSNCPISKFSGFEGSRRLSDYLNDITTRQTRVVISGGTRYPAPKYSGLKDIKLPSSITSLAGFSNCDQLENLLLSHCYRLKNVYDFSNCTSLDSIALPPQLTSISGFNGCHIKRMSIATINPPKITDIDNFGFTEAVVWVPEGSSGIYRMSEGWSLCKDFKNGGYTIDFNAEGPICLLNGAGLYPAGATALFSFNASSENQIQDYFVNWIIDDNYLQGNNIPYTVTKHTKVNIRSSLSTPNIEKGDIIIELTSKHNTSCNIIINPTLPNGSLDIYTEDGYIHAGSTGLVEKEISINAGETIKLAIVGQASSLSLSADEDVTLKRLDFNDYKSINNLAIESLNIEALDITDCYNLSSIVLSYNQLKHLDVSKNKKLSILICINNLLEELNLSSNDNLIFLDCSNNFIKDLDLAPDSPRETLIFENNPIAFSVITPHIYDILMSNGSMTIPFNPKPIFDESTGILDLSNELYDKESNSPTSISFLKNGQNITIEDEGNAIYNLSPGTYQITMTNDKYPNLMFIGNLFVEGHSSTKQLSDSDKVEIRINNGTIIVQGLPNKTEVKLFAPNGSCIATSESNGGVAQFQPVPHGIYLLYIYDKSNRYCHKIVM